MSFLKGQLQIQYFSFEHFIRFAKLRPDISALRERGVLGANTSGTLSVNPVNPYQGPGRQKFIQIEKKMNIHLHFTLTSIGGFGSTQKTNIVGRRVH